MRRLALSSSLNSAGWVRPFPHVAAEAVRGGLEVGERLDVDVFLRDVRAARGGERDGDVDTRITSGLLDRRDAAEHDEVGEGDLRAGLTGERLGDTLERPDDAGEFLGLVGLPADLRLQAETTTVGATAEVAAAERGCGRPRGLHQLRDRQSRLEQDGLQRGDVGVGDERSLVRRDVVLPAVGDLGNQRAAVADRRTHVAVEQLEPRLGEFLGQLLGVIQPAAGDLAVLRVVAQCEITGQHRRVGRAVAEAFGTVPSPAPSFGRHWLAPAGLL